MNQSSFDEPDEFTPNNRLTEYFRSMAEKKASQASESTEGGEGAATDDAVTSESGVDNSWLENDREAAEGDGSIVESDRRYFPEDMVTPQFFNPCYLSHLRGDLRSFLSVIGLGSEDDFAAVQSLLEQRVPTINDESDHLFGLIEQELVQMCLGGCTRVGDFTEEGFALDVKVEERRLKAMELLAFVRVKRLELRSKRSA